MSNLLCTMTKIRLLFVLFAGTTSLSLAWTPGYSSNPVLFSQRRQENQVSIPTILRLSGWSDFQALDLDEDDDDVVLGRRVDRNDYAIEDDSQEVKAQVGASLEPPSVDRPAPPIQVPAGRFTCVSR